MRFILLPPVIMLLVAGAMLLLDRYIPLSILWGAPYIYAGGFFIVAGLGVANWHARLFRKLGTNINTFGEPGKLTREGLYRVSRNPMYLGFVVTLAGVATLLGSASPFIAVIGFAILTNYWYIPFEERAMLQKFGPEYIEYRRRVRRWL